MTLDEARDIAEPGVFRRPDQLGTALVVALAEVDRLTADRLRWAQENAEIAEDVDRAREVNDKLAAEVSRLRALPVLKACGQCADFVLDSQRERDGGWCEHQQQPDGHVDRRASSASAAPPSWCPLRKDGSR